MEIVSDEAIRKYISTEILPIKCKDTIEYKQGNIAVFNGLDRTGLEYGSRQFCRKNITELKLIDVVLANIVVEGCIFIENCDIR